LKNLCQNKIFLILKIFAVAIVATTINYTSANQQSWEQRSWEKQPNGALTYPEGD
jgi:hypothetical protein